MPTVSYTKGMDWFASWHRELAQSDRDPKTVERYWQIVSSYQQWLGDRELSIAMAKEFLAYLREKGYRPKSVLLYYHALRQLFDHMGLTFKLKLRKPRVLPRYHDVGDFEALLAAAKRGMYHQTREERERNHDLVLTLGYTGLRKSELQNLAVGDIDFNNRRLLVRQGKGQKDRVVPLANRVITPLRNQCAGKNAQERVFAGLNARSIYRIVTNCAKAAGLEGFHVHSLRHWFASQLVERGVNLRQVQLLLGHQSLETTAVYIDIAPQHLQSAVATLDSQPVPEHQVPSH